jgi:sec-independent protein translocase protein TatB
MMPQFGMGEFLIVAIVALIVVGPRDLPLMMRKLGRMFSKARIMARDFQKAFDDMGKEAELDELRKEIEALKKDNAITGLNDAVKSVNDDLKKL